MFIRLSTFDWSYENDSIQNNISMNFSGRRRIKNRRKYMRWWEIFAWNNQHKSMSFVCNVCKHEHLSISRTELKRTKVVKSLYTQQSTILSLSVYGTTTTRRVEIFMSWDHAAKSKESSKKCEQLKIIVRDSNILLRHHVTSHHTGHNTFT